MALWNINTDTLHFAVKTAIPENHTLITIRKNLQQSSKIFHSLSYLFPVTIQAKLLLQQNWQKNVQWDEPLPQSQGHPEKSRGPGQRVKGKGGSILNHNFTQAVS